MVAPKNRVPERGDIGWLSLQPQQGREQTGHRPVLCLSPSSYNAKSGLAVFCPISSKKKGYPFEVEIKTKTGIDGVVLADQLKSLDWRSRKFKFITKSSDSQLAAVVARASALIF